MAKTRARTKSTADSSTKTRPARLAHIKVQLRLLLDQTVTISTASVQKIALGIEKKIIGKLYLEAEDEEDFCYARLSLEIDWNEHDRQLEVGNGFVEVEDEEDMELEIRSALDVFNEVVDCEDLTVCWGVNYRKGVDHAWADKLLGFKDVGPTKWKADPIGRPYPVKRLSEMKVVLTLADTE